MLAAAAAIDAEAQEFRTAKTEGSSIIEGKEKGNKKRGPVEPKSLEGKTTISKG